MIRPTEIENAVEPKQFKSAEEFLPLVYNELHRLASIHLSKEKPGQTLQPTALVHEVFLRLIGPGNASGFANRRHFFGAAAQAMRRILVEHARMKSREKRGGDRSRTQLDLNALQGLEPDAELLELHEALDALSRHDSIKAQLVELRFFGGLTLEQAAECLDISLSTADRAWRYARAWLYTAMAEESPEKLE